ncbi:MAG: ABC transporter permease, partial [Rhodospirillales bacterium]|nr:ABC transporter permease [Rhodospirillales bacterium]
QAMAAVGGDTGATKDLISVMEGATIVDSPRGAWKMSKAHNPIQDIYLRQVKSGENLVLGVAAKNLEDPATGCSMA